MYLFRIITLHSLGPFVLVLSIIAAATASPVPSPGASSERGDKGVSTTSSKQPGEEDSVKIDTHTIRQIYYITLACKSEQTDIERACTGGKTVLTLDPMAIWTVGFVAAAFETRLTGGYRTQRQGNPPYNWSPVADPGHFSGAYASTDALSGHKAKFNVITLGWALMSVNERREVTVAVNKDLKNSHSDAMPNIFFLHRALWYIRVNLHLISQLKEVRFGFDLTKAWKEPFFDVMVELKGTAAGSIVTKEDWEWNSYNLILENPDDPQWMKIWKKFDELRQGSVVQKAG
ncbi:hypothetical protein EV361DRAFT_938538 [Lentinula raphanica]|uniref:Uncharacterized protein n=1 Tax=Lentinula raphanica TaxID=153919 RepID=A0AA38U779_9AGAR|nr:hypothetical protein F5878DRAFT_401187 [Lentinula raphanica]KAJ3965597.1 hypothetical protein EV361DRAFT_938538 [Lentinula raphanica]